MKTVSFDAPLSFTNDGVLSLFFLGTGSAFSKKYYQTNMLIVKGSDHLLVDCGSMCPNVLETLYAAKLASVKNLLLTHPHADHIGGVEELALVGKYVAKKPINLIITDEFKKKLWNESLRGGLQFSEYGKMNFDDYFTQQKPRLIAKKPFSIYDADIGTINIKLFRSYHITSKKNSFKNSQYSTGLIIDDRILFSGDSQFREDQLNTLLAMYPIETIFHDCDFSGKAEAVHASYSQLKTLPADIRAKTLLCHYNSTSEKFDVTADGFAGLARPGMYYNFG